jgi:hypothetical protein
MDSGVESGVAEQESLNPGPRIQHPALACLELTAERQPGFGTA